MMGYLESEQGAINNMLEQEPIPSKPRQKVTLAQAGSSLNPDSLMSTTNFGLTPQLLDSVLFI